VAEPEEKAKKEKAKKEDDAPVEEEEEAIHTSDAEARVEGVSYADVEPDPQEGAKSTDAASYDFPPGGDVDVSTIPTDELEGETRPAVPPDARVILGDTVAVPEDVQGAPAFVVATYEDEDGNQLFDARSRDEHNTLVTGLTRDDVKVVVPGGVGSRGFGP